MCFRAPKPHIDRTVQEQQQKEAAEARQREAERQARIRSGTERVNNSFSAFNDDYYDKRQKDYLGYYQPQLDDQFEKAKTDLTYALARTGNLASTAAADRQAELTNRYKTEQASLLSQALADRAAAEARVNQERSSLISQLNASSNADQVSDQATARTRQMFNEIPAYNSLGDVFAGFAQGIDAINRGIQRGRTVNAYYGYNRSPRGSATTTVG